MSVKKISKYTVSISQNKILHLLNIVGSQVEAGYKSDFFDYPELYEIFKRMDEIKDPDRPESTLDIATVNKMTQEDRNKYYKSNEYNLTVAKFQGALKAHERILNELKEKRSQLDEEAKNVFLKIILAKLIPLRKFINTDKWSELIFCVYKDYVYKFDRTGYSEEEMLLQVMDLEDEERRKFERLKNKFSVSEEIEKEGKRPGIPEGIRIAIWRRDEGKCVKCSSRVDLEYDHIIPISKGGSNTVRNIELLCESCNRRKSDNIL